MENLRLKFEEYGQGHVFKFLDKNLVPEKDRAGFLEELEDLDLKRIQGIYQASMEGSSKDEEGGKLEPICDYDSVSNFSSERVLALENRGLECIANGKTCALILAGGQGTRLGFDGPKGAYDIGMPSGSSLFQYFSERVVKLQQLASMKTNTLKVEVKVYIMTSKMNHDETSGFFDKHDYFGLKKHQVVFFQQGTLPCLDGDGKIILESSGKIAKASDGNGGIYTALPTSGVLDEMDKNGIVYVHTFSVDNVMCKPVDPVFVGYCLEKNADVGSKVVWKKNANESVGVVAKRDGKYCIVEYSEMDQQVSEQLDENNDKLLYGAGNICNHMFSMEFLRAVMDAGELKFHVAHKKIPYAGDDGNTVKPTENSGIKLEAFIFDVFPLSKNMAVLDIIREDEFSPVKNAPGSKTDSPDTARSMLSGQARHWLENAGCDFTSHMITAGAVKKQCNRSIKRWNDRYLVIDTYTNKFKFFKSESEYTNGTKKSAWGTLLSYTICKDNKFECRTSSGENKVFRLTSEEDVPKWVQALDDAFAAENRANRLCEVSPLVSYCGEDLDDMIGKKLTLPFHLTASCRQRVSEQAGQDIVFDSHTMNTATVLKSKNDQLADVQVTRNTPVPELSTPTSVLVEVAFATLNPVDVAMFESQSTLVEPVILGCEMAGIVSKVGSAVTNFKIGDKVAGFRNNGCLAEFAEFPADSLCIVPNDISLAVASLLPYSGLTALQCLSKAKPGDDVLIISGKGGVAYIAAQLAKNQGCNACTLITREHSDKYKQVGCNVISTLKEAGTYFSGPASLVIDCSDSPTSISDAEIIANAQYLSIVPQDGSTRHNTTADTSIIQKIFDLVQRRVLRTPEFSEVLLDNANNALNSLRNGTQSTRYVFRIRSARIDPEVRAAFVAAGQDHIFKFYDEGTLKPQEVDEFLAQLESIDLSKAIQAFDSSFTNAPVPESAGNLEPLADVKLLEDLSPKEVKKWENAGLQAISKGKVGAVVLSGGQGTRLGFSGPKGMYDIGLPSSKTLFQLFAERIVRMQQLAQQHAKTKNLPTIPWYIMTSQMNDQETRDFFVRNQYFGLLEDQIFFFKQGMLPCFTTEGKLMLESSYKLAMASDGNGGIYSAMESTGALEDMKSKGVEYLHVFAVDNAICKTVDPVFLGCCISQKSDCGNKVLWKNSPDEQVGILAKRDGKFCVVEYSEIDKESCEKVDENGKLVYGAANICNHFYTVDFLVNNILPNLSLQYHVAHKKIPITSADGITMKVTKNNGIKLEAFIFDVFPQAKNMAVLSVNRDEEFSPVKNAPGNPVDSPDSARIMISEQGKKWLSKVGVEFDSGDALVEISPLCSYGGEQLKQFFKNGAKLDLSHNFTLFGDTEMASPCMVSDALRERLELAGQAHLLRFIDGKKVLAPDASTALNELEALDFKRLNQIFADSMAHDSTASSTTAEIEPLKSFDELLETEVDETQSWIKKGLAAIAAGEVAAITLAGGQGTRLGFAGPKGNYKIGLPSKTSLFGLFAMRLNRLQVIAGLDHKGAKNLIPWYIMTSKMNHEETVQHFQDNDYFGLAKEDVFFFQQGTLPCFTENGKILLESNSKIAEASDGNGGIYPALQTSGAIADMEKRSIKFMHVFAVDNAICKAADPLFVGYCITKGSDCGNKVVWKNSPDEKVGVVAIKDSKFCVVEYSEMDDASVNLRDEKTGKLKFGAGNICNHFYTMDFLKNTVLPNLSTQYHVARKKIPYADGDGATVKPNENNGVKLESFIFDVFPLSSNMAVLSVPRDEEFSPVKNPPGSNVDSPDTALAMLSQQAIAWIEFSGGKVDQSESSVCEVLPSVSYGGEGLENLVDNKTIKLPTTLREPRNMGSGRDFLKSYARQQAKCKVSNDGAAESEDMEKLPTVNEKETPIATKDKVDQPSNVAKEKDFAMNEKIEESKDVNKNSEIGVPSSVQAACGNSVAVLEPEETPKCSCSIQ